jgi:hypothetical protein
METTTGTVVEVRANGASLELEDGSRRVLEATPAEEILIEVGTPVSVTDSGDGKSVYTWGSPTASDTIPNTLPPKR